MAFKPLPSYEGQERIIQLLEGINKGVGMGNVYGIHWNKNTDEVERIADSVGKSYTKETDGDVTTIKSDFDDKYPFAGLRRCNLEMSSGNVLQYYGHTDYTDTPDEGVEVMVEVPKFYYKTERTTNGISWYITAESRDEFKLYPAFERDGTEKDKIYVSAYEGAVYDTSNNEFITSYDGDTELGEQTIGTLSDGILRSVKGQQPTVQHDITEFRTMAEQNDGEQYDALSHWALTMLFIIEFATLNSQSVFSGVTDYDSGSNNHSQNTGHTNVLGNQSGEVEVDAENGATGQTSQPVFSYRGVENLYGNVWKFMDGANISPSGEIGAWYIANHSFESNKFSDNYSKVGVYPAEADRDYISDIIINDDIDYGFIPSELNASSSTGYADYTYTSDSTERVARVGRFWYDPEEAGVFCLALTGSSSGSSGRDSGTRLIKF